MIGLSTRSMKVPTVSQAVSRIAWPASRVNQAQITTGTVIGMTPICSAARARTASASRPAAGTPPYIMPVPMISAWTAATPSTPRATTRIVPLAMSTKRPPRSPRKPAARRRNSSPMRSPGT